MDEIHYNAAEAIAQGAAACSRCRWTWSNLQFRDRSTSRCGEQERLEYQKFSYTWPSYIKNASAESLNFRCPKHIKPESFCFFKPKKLLNLGINLSSYSLLVSLFNSYSSESFASPCFTPWSPGPPAPGRGHLWGRQAWRNAIDLNRLHSKEMHWDLIVFFCICGR